MKKLLIMLLCFTAQAQSFDEYLATYNQRVRNPIQTCYAGCAAMVMEMCREAAERSTNPYPGYENFSIDAAVKKIFPIYLKCGKVCGKLGTK